MRKLFLSLFLLGTGHFYGVKTATSNKYDGNGHIVMEYVTSNVNTSYKTTAYQIDNVVTKDKATNKKKLKKIINESFILSQDPIPFHPRIRPWYILAMNNYNQTYSSVWTNVYTFFGVVTTGNYKSSLFIITIIIGLTVLLTWPTYSTYCGETDGGLGITLAKALPGRKGVIAIDITLNQVSTLLTNKIQSLGKFNASSKLWVSEKSPLGNIIGVGFGGQWNTDSSSSTSSATTRLTPITVEEIKEDAMAVASLQTASSLKTNGTAMIYEETHTRNGNGINHQEITIRKINGGSNTNGLNWWLVQSMHFKDFIREVQVEGSAALLVGVVLSFIAAMFARLSHYVKHDRKSGKEKKDLKKSIIVAKRLRQETITMTKCKQKY